MHPIAINKKVYDILTSNTLVGPTMAEDSTPLFDASGHVNIFDPSNVPSLTSLNTARAQFRAILAQKAMNDEDARPTGATPKYIISGPANETTIDNIVNNLPNIQVSGTNTVNPYTAGGRTPLVPIIDAYLGALVKAQSKEYAWYLAANQAILPTFKIYYLNGNMVPTFRSENSSVGRALGIIFDSFFDWTVMVQDWRGLLYCDGAAT
jgi:hypothetical protein